MPQNKGQIFYEVLKNKGVGLAYFLTAEKDLGVGPASKLFARHPLGIAKWNLNNYDIKDDKIIDWTRLLEPRLNIRSICRALSPAGILRPSSSFLKSIRR
jgi:hypothetical protein